MRRALFLITLPLLLTAPAAQGQTATPAPSPREAAVAERLILRPAEPGTIVTVEAHFRQRPGVCEAKQRKPLRARYRGRIEIIREANGSLSIINQLPFSDYLSGLAEVPPAWAMEALRAQALAARSYALYQMSHRAPSFRRRGFHICATDQCQVYRGAAVELGAFGERWRRAVMSTRGKIIAYRGSPIQAFYFSTSTGRTRSNRDVWGTPPLPYLPSVPAHDEDSPLASWTSLIRVSDVGPILRRAGRWGSGAVAAVSDAGDNVRVTGGGRSVTMSKQDFRRAFNNEAACLFPARYPPPGKRPGSKLPLTVPGSTYSVVRDGGDILLRGRGWGHGVGMSQYGAKALAERGRTATEIVTYFYRGTAVRTVSEPGAIRVLAEEGARRIRLSIQGRMRITTDTGSRLAPGKRFEVSGTPSLRIRRGVGPSLAPVLRIDTRLGPATVEPGSTRPVRFSLNRSARVTLLISNTGGTVARRKASFESGPAAIPAPFAALPVGVYRVVLEAFDGIDTVRTKPVAITVASANAADTASPEPSSPPPLAAGPASPGDRSRLWLIAAAAFALLAAIVAVGGVANRRRGRAGRDPG